MFETSKIELSEAALRENLAFIRSNLPENVIFSSVIKGNAYGHGIQYFLPMAERCGVRHFAVFNADEALEAVKHRTRDSHIMIMGYISDEALEWAVENRLSFFVFDMERLLAALDAATRLGVPARVHLELETGMHRTGFEAEELEGVVELVKRNSHRLRVEGLCTHFAGAESIGNYYRIQRQIEGFNHRTARLLREGGLGEAGRILRHTACSSAALVYPETIMDMVRIGIAQYGYWPSKEAEIFYSARAATGDQEWIDPLVRVLRWTSKVMSLKRVKRGDYVGYGTMSLVTREQRIASVPVGYFHGYSRTLSNKGHVLIAGKPAPVLGLVNMNMMMVDVTDIPEVRRGDEVVLVGRQGEQEISVGSFGEMISFINYEILVRLPSEIPRVVVDGDGGA